MTAIAKENAPAVPSPESTAMTSGGSRVRLKMASSSPRIFCMTRNRMLSGGPQMKVTLT